MSTFDYERIWQEAWGDIQRYGAVHRHHRRIFSSLFKKLSGSGIKTIADIGCGEGSNLYFLRSEFPSAQLYGFDVSQTALEVAKKSVNAEFIQLDIQRDVPPQKYDLVLCTDVIEHLEDDIAALKNIKHITGRYAIVATVQGHMRANEEHIGHVRNYDYGELQQKMTSAGFEIIKVIEWGYPFYSPLFRDLIGFSRAAENYSYGKYNFFKKFVSHVLYSIFLLNRHDKGDVIFIMAKT